MKKNKKVLVIGAGIDQLDMIKLCKRRGYEVLALDFNPNAPGFAHCDKAIIASTKDKEKVTAVAQEEAVDAITSFITESGHHSILHATQALDLPIFLSDKGVRATTNKIEMRKILQTQDLNDLPFCEPATFDEVKAFADEHGYPLVLKTSQSAGQTNVFKIHDFDQLDQTYHQYFLDFKAGEVILERFVSGPEINIVYTAYDGIIQDLIISDRQTNQDAFGVAKRHECPSKYYEAMKDKVRRKCQAINDCLEIKNAVVYPQMIISESGAPILLELGVRVPGGHVKEVMEYKTGMDLLTYCLDISLGELQPYEHYRTLPVYPCVYVTFLNAEPGALRSGKVHQTLNLDAFDDVDWVKGIDYFGVNRDLRQINPLKEGKDRFFYIITTGSTKIETHRRFLEVLHKIDLLDEHGQSLINKAFDFENFYLVEAVEENSDS